MWRSSLSSFCNPSYSVFIVIILSCFFQQSGSRVALGYRNSHRNPHDMKSKYISAQYYNNGRFRRQTTSLDVFFDLVTLKYPIDVVFALERSTRATKPNFYIKQKKFVKSLIRDFMYIKPNATHVAVVTFARDVDVVFNSIWRNEPHNSYQELRKCDLVEDQTLWSKVKYIDDPASSEGANITLAYITAKDILLQGRFKRPKAQSVFVLLTSADYSDDEYDPFKIGDIDWIRTFGVAVVNWYQEERLARIVNSQYAVHAKMSEWNDMIMMNKRFSNHIVAHSPSEFVPYNSVVCPCSDRALCYCDVITGYSRCACNGGFEDHDTSCTAPCSKAACSSQFGHFCQDGASGLSHVCSCNPAVAQTCGGTVDDCPPGVCANNGVCVDGINTYACSCPYGKTGRHCEVEENECEPSSCPDLSTCLDGPNSYFCTGETTTPFNRQSTTQLSRPATSQMSDISVEEEDRGFIQGLSQRDSLLLILVPSISVALIGLIAGITAIVYVVRQSDRRRGNMSHGTETTSVISRNASLLSFDSKCYTDEGTPRAPKTKERTSYANSDMDILYGNEAAQRGMEEWYAYVLELFHNHGLNRVIIVRLDGEKWVLSPGSKLHMTEIEAAYNILSHKMASGKLVIQGREFGVVSNDDFVTIAHSVSNKRKPQEIAISTKTRQFVIIGTADFATDKGRCRRKIVELRDHIKKQGL